MHVELRHLRYFLAVAEELNFSRAAARLYIAQPALSAQIRVLETQLGCKLFVRTTRKVELTPSGQMLLEDARDIVARTDDAVARVQAAARGERSVLRIGFVAHGAAETGAEILRRFSESFPAVELQFVEEPTLEEIQRHIRDRVTDVGFAWLPILYEELEAATIRSERVVVCIHEEHPLAAREAVGWSDIAAAPIVAPGDEVPWEVLKPWLERARPTGRRAGDPNGKGLEQCLALAISGAGVYCVPGSVERYFARPQLVFRPIVDGEPVEIGVAWRRDAENPAVASFVETALEVAAAGAVAS